MQLALSRPYPKCVDVKDFRISNHYLSMWCHMQNAIFFIVARANFFPFSRSGHFQEDRTAETNLKWKG